MDSILTSTKKLLGLDEAYTAFDTDIIMYINSALADLEQLGVGPVGGFQITDKTEVWDDFLGNDPRLNSVKTYVALRARLLFDPPTTPHVLTSMNEQIQKAEWRINVHREGVAYP